MRRSPLFLHRSVGTLAPSGPLSKTSFLLQGLTTESADGSFLFLPVPIAARGERGILVRDSIGGGWCVQCEGDEAALPSGMGVQAATAAGI